MLKKLSIDNFKAFNDFEIYFNPVTFVIGANAAGKSGLLTAIVFLKYCSTDTVNAYMDYHKLAVSDLCSKLANSQRITFSAIFDFDGKEVSWEICFLANKTENSIRLFSEEVASDGVKLLRFFPRYYRDRHGKKRVISKSFRVNEKDKSEEEIRRGLYRFSLVSLIGSEDAEIYPTLFSIKKFFEATTPFDLLSPKDMRDSSRARTDTIGRYGEMLAAFVKSISSDEKRDLVKTVQSVFPRVSDIKAVVRGRPGWAYIEVEETYENGKISVSSRNVSDGVIRIIAFFAMKYHKSSGGVSLLDEIENGINSEIMEPVLRALQNNCEKSKQQFIASTHNTVLLDFIDSDNIRYLARDEFGHTIAYNPFEREELREKLEYMYPGEVLLNTPNEQLSSLAKGVEGMD